MQDKAHLRHAVTIPVQDFKKAFTNLGGSPHQQLAKSINAENKNVVGGLFRADGKDNIFTNENSRHMEKIGLLNQGQFVKFMREQTGMNITHESW